MAINTINVSNVSWFNKTDQLQYEKSTIKLDVYKDF